MNNSSAQPSYSITSIDTSDTITIDLSSFTLTNSSGYGSTITLGGTGATGSTISSPLSFNNIWETTQEWSDSFPEWRRVQDMCNTYPGLKIAFEKFKTTYHLVKDDYDNPTTNK